ncbi:MAG TPA: hypothetical protein VE907_16810 [Gammaproteobacteria bacterium]|nr:hypothetical protein [Gammaproteobacteria bacterium]
MKTDVAATAVVLAGCLLVLKRLGRWKHRFGAIGSPLIEPPTYRALFLLVLIGALLISVLPEAAFVLPALDAVGLDIVTILVVFELRHYLASAARFVGIPTNAGVYLRIPAQVARRCGDILRTNPRLWLYACMWPLIWLRTIKGTMPPSVLV